MKTAFVALFFSGILCFITYGKEKAVELPVDQIIAGSNEIFKKHDKWLEEKPRKIVVQFFEANELPEILQKLGYKGATVQKGFIMLLSTEKQARTAQGIFISAGGEHDEKGLTDEGWTVTPSVDPRIKMIEQARPD